MSDLNLSDKDLSRLNTTVRQLRFKTKRAGLPHDIPYHAVIKLVRESSGCEFCDARHQLTLHKAVSEAPLLLANLIVCCQDCLKCNFNRLCPDIVSLLSQDKITLEKFAAILSKLMQQPGADEVRAVIRKVTGLD